ncbi:urate oxidase [Nakamurella flava]|uniref:Uricase n=1 Tax=Nakamurella flava TaxID=2576308 RepID=A0A4U6QK46_9ACTN|nr:urate oxidase [Nakamurella flava]TKV60619.1 urate oxidase [Nakamurella flava]
MAVSLGHNQYGKAETRVVRVYRDSDPHEIVDYNVSVALSGDFEDIHHTGDNANCLTTDATKNTVNAFAKEHGEAARQPESFGIALAKHFVDDTAPVSRARIKIEMYPWNRLQHDGTPHPHAFARSGEFVRTATVTYDGENLYVVSGVKDYTVLKTTDSEFHGFLTDRYTTLQPTTDRVMATSVTGQWLHTDTEQDWSKSFDQVVATMSSVFAGHHSLALQQTMYAMGEAIITEQPEIGEVRFSLPNKHHFVVDLSPFGLENDNEVFYAADRAYGLIEGTIRNDAFLDRAPAAGAAFDPGQGW